MTNTPKTGEGRPKGIMLSMGYKMTRSGVDPSGVGKMKLEVAVSLLIGIGMRFSNMYGQNGFWIDKIYLCLHCFSDGVFHLQVV